MTRRRKFAIFAILFSVTLTTMFGILEGGARLLGFQPRRHYVFDAARGWICDPHSKFQYVGTLGRIRATIDGEGFRPTVAGRENGGSPVIVCLGDSFTFCGESADERTWPEFMSRELSRLGPPCRAVNRGMTGYSPVQSLAALSHELRRNGGAGRPRAVVYFFCINDARENFEPDRPHLDAAEISVLPKFTEEPHPRMYPPVPPRKSLLSKLWDLRDRSAFVNGVKSGTPLTSLASFTEGGKRYAQNFGPKYREFLDTPTQQEGMRLALRKLRQECADAGAALFVSACIMPAWDGAGKSRGEFRDLLGWSEETLAAQVSDYHASLDLLGTWVAEIGAEYVDIRGCLGDMRYREYVAAALDWHFSEAANEKIGKALAARILPLLANAPGAR